MDIRIGWINSGLQALLPALLYNFGYDIISSYNFLSFLFSRCLNTFHLFFSVSVASLLEGTVRPIIHCDKLLNLKPETPRGEGI